jgi:hypothetical protein
MRDGRIGDVAMELETAALEAGDTIGFIDWSAVVGLTWRRRMKHPAKGGECEAQVNRIHREGGDNGDE